MKQFNQNNKEHPQQTTMEKTMTGRIQLKQLSETHALLVADHQALKLQTNEQCDVIRRQMDDIAFLQKAFDSQTLSCKQLFTELEKKDAEIAALKKLNEGLLTMDEESEDEESEDEDDGEMEVYFETETFGNLCGEHEHLKEFHDFHYYQCWGGGGDGGYIVNEKNFVFRVERNWGTPFSVEKVAGFIKETERDGLKFIRII
jgi:hypothetical protein